MEFGSFRKILGWQISVALDDMKNSKHLRIILIKLLIIICDIYIAPNSARSCCNALYNIIYNIIIPDSDPFPPNTYLNSQGRIQGMLPL